MDVKPIGRKSIYEDIVLQIKKMLESGELAPGDKLPPERSLAEMFAVSRNSVREAIKALAEQDVLESRQGAGTFVREQSTGSLLPDFSRIVTDEKAAVRDVFEVRKILEPEIAAMAARNASPGEVTRLEAALVEQETALSQGRISGTLDQRFHKLLAEASGNDVLRAMVTALHDDFTESRADALQSEERQQASLAAHRAIVEAVRDGHVMQAEKAMREHLEEIESIVFSG